MSYRVVRRVMFLLPAERIHTWVFAALRLVTATALARRMLLRRCRCIRVIRKEQVKQGYGKQRNKKELGLGIRG